MCRFTLTEVKELVYEGFEKVTPERWQSLIKHVEQKVEDHYWEADGLNEELLERFIITNSDSESSDDEGVNEGFSDDSTSFGSMSESTDSSDEEVGTMYYNYILRFLCMFRNEGIAFRLDIYLNSSKSDEV